MKAWRPGMVAACALLLLAACASQLRSPGAALPPAERLQALAAQEEREAALAAQPDWSLSGRAAISRGGKGGSGRLDWRQAGARYEVSLAAPVTRQSWRLSGGDGQARLEGLEGGTREGPDGSALLLEASGLEVPVAALASWMRGARADEVRFGPAELSFAADHRPARLLQAGWVIDYLAWEETADADGGPVLPLRVDARRGDARVRLVVDAWSSAEAP